MFSSFVLASTRFSCTLGNLSLVFNWRLSRELQVGEFFLNTALSLSEFLSFLLGAKSL